MEKVKAKEEKVDFRGSLFIAYMDVERKTYYCPICGVGEDKPMFFGVEDLMAHVRTHIKRRIGAPKHVLQSGPKQTPEE